MFHSEQFIFLHIHKINKDHAKVNPKAKYATIFSFYLKYKIPTSKNEITYLVTKMYYPFMRVKVKKKKIEV